MDRAVIYVLLGKTISILSGLSIILLIPHFLSEELQGYYYTFNSLVALQIIFELGFSGVIIQFVSHEMAALQYVIERKTFEGELQKKQRILSIVTFSIRWYGAIAMAIVLFVGPTGYIFFSLENNGTIHWQNAWITLTVATAINVFFISVVSIAEGCGLVVKVNKMRAIQASLAALLSIFFLVSGYGLYATAAIAISGCVVYLIFALRYFSRTLHESFFTKIAENLTFSGISWKKEILPMQWRIALSWMSGYFIFFAMTPIAFKYFGPVYAGKLGMSLTLCNMIMATGLAWVSTRFPKWGKLISQGNRAELDASFRGSLIQSSCFVLICLIGAICSLITLNYLEFDFTQRFFSPGEFSILCVAILGSHLVACMATYIRAHKIEKMAMASLIMAILTTSCMSLVAVLHFERWYMVVYCLIVWVYFVPHAFLIFREFKRNNG
ncbi:Polysaccharide biosynthesis protein [Kosakonia sp. BK9b]